MQASDFVNVEQQLQADQQTAIATEPSTTPHTRRHRHWHHRRHGRLL
jgi:hypothetical protein